MISDTAYALKKNNYTAQKFQDRLIDFACAALKICEPVPYNVPVISLSGQLGRSGKAPELIYSEARTAESKRNFIHKMRLCLQELRESHTCLRIIYRMQYVPSETGLTIESEANELVAIFTKSIRTKKRIQNHKS